jgi:hypothetical protein
MGTSIMRGEMRSGAQHAQQSDKMMNQMSAEAGTNAPLKPGPIGHGAKAPKFGSKDGAPVKPAHDYKLAKQGSSKAKIPDSLFPSQPPTED